MKSITIEVAKKVFTHSKKAFSFFTLTLFLFSSFLILSQYAEAQLVCPMRAIQQITDEPSGGSDKSSISADGTLIAFESDADINGGNPDGNDNIWLANARTGIITQITNTMVGVFNSDSSISADGTRIAFESDADITGMNPDGNQEIFLFDMTTGIITQITDTMVVGKFASNPSISGNGLFIAFASNADINGGNPDGNFEIFLFDTTTGMFTQVTDTMGVGIFSGDPSVNADGTRIAFESRANITGGNPDGNEEIFLFDMTTGMFTQITDTMGGFNENPSINADGTRIAFESRANINGGNPDGNSEIWLFDMTTGMISQITNTMGGSNAQASISADGLFIGFRTTSNLNGGNPEGNDEVLIFNTTTGVITYITNEPEGQSERPSVNADGTRIAFESRANINGGNPEENDEIWLATCFDRHQPIPTLSEWGLIAMAGILGLVGFMVMRRRKVSA